MNPDSQPPRSLLHRPVAEQLHRDYSFQFSANARLPLVAGWDHSAGWFTRLHPKYRTPVNSIFFLGGVALAASFCRAHRVSACRKRFN